jgi:putative two-component system response regulator
MMEGPEKQKILIVDDEEMNLKMIAFFLENYGYAFDTAKNGREALDKVKTFSPDLVLMDIMMPEMDGYETCRRLREDPATSLLPVVMVTALNDRDSRIRGLEAGANDFLTKPLDTTELLVRTRNLLQLKDFHDFLARHNEILEAEVRQRTSELALALEELKESKDTIKRSYIDTIQRLTMVAEFKDEDTGVHIRRISYYCALTAEHLGWSREDVETISYASPMHDIGKVGIPSDILLKPARLTPEEFGLIKTHTTIGGRILRGSISGMVQVAETIALSHHERWDGGGYPAGLMGEEIPEAARIMNIADQYDALRSRRPYKPSLSHEEAVKIISEGDGRTMPNHFDPRVLQAFKDAHRRFEEIFEEHRG